MDGKRTLLDWLGLGHAPDWRVARPLGHLVGCVLLLAVPLLVLGAIAAAGAVLWQTISGGAGTTGLGTGALIVGLLGAPFLVWSTVIRHHTLRYQKEGHITDRISKAVEQLGAEKTVKKDGKEATVPNIEVRIGAILSLERIAQDSTAHDNGRDHVRVMEILCAYVRENAPVSGASPGPFPQDSNEGSLQAKIDRDPRSWIASLPRPRADVQIALSVIGRRSTAQIDVENAFTDGKATGFVLDLSHSCLRKADLEGLNFSNANFFRSLLEGAYCRDADFPGANFIYGKLIGLSGTNPNLRGAKLEVSDFSYANLGHADFRDCSLSHTHFVKTNLRNAKFKFEDNPDGRIVNRAFFVRASLQEAALEGDIIGLNFSYNIREGYSYPFELEGVLLRGARFSYDEILLGTELLYRAFDPEWLSVAFGDGTVIIHAGDRPAHWPTHVLDDAEFNTEYQRWRANPAAYTPPPPPEQD